MKFIAHLSKKIFDNFLADFILSIKYQLINLKVNLALHLMAANHNRSFQKIRQGKKTKSK